MAHRVGISFIGAMWTFIDYSLQRRSLSSLSNSQRFRHQLATDTSTSRCQLPTSQASTSTRSLAFLSTANTRRSPRGGKRVLALWMDHFAPGSSRITATCFVFLISALTSISVIPIYLPSVSSSYLFSGRRSNRASQQLFPRISAS